MRHRDDPVSVLFLVFIGVCYIGVMAASLYEHDYWLAVLGFCWGTGNFALAAIKANL